jgi:hypothetical protein
VRGGGGNVNVVIAPCPSQSFEATAQGTGGAFYSDPSVAHSASGR